jgi:hypothetical protein
MMTQGVSQSAGGKQSVSELMRSKAGEEEKAMMDEMESYKPESETVKEMVEEVSEMEPGPECDAKIDEVVKKLEAMKSKKAVEKPKEEKSSKPPFRFE